MGTPLFDTLNIRYWEEQGRKLIFADDLERFLEGCPEAFANDTDKGWGEYVPGRDTKKCRIICVQEINKPAKKLYEYVVQNHCMRSAKSRWFESDEEFRLSYDKTYPIVKTGREVELP